MDKFDCVKIKKSVHKTDHKSHDDLDQKHVKTTKGQYPEYVKKFQINF